MSNKEIKKKIYISLLYKLRSFDGEKSVAHCSNGNEPKDKFNKRYRVHEI